MSYQDVVEKLAQVAGANPALGKLVRFDLGSDGAVFLDGTGAANTVVEDGDDADATIAITADNLVKMLSGGLSPTMAFMTGKLKVSGDMSVAMKLSQLIED